MTNEEIEKACDVMAVKRTNTPLEYSDGFHDGVQWVLDKASDGFEEWYKDYRKGGSIYDHQKEAWEAAKLSAQKEIEQLRRNRDEHLTINTRIVQDYTDLLYKYNEAVKDLKWALNTCETSAHLIDDDIDGECAEVVNIVKEIRKRHGIGEV